MQTCAVVEAEQPAVSASAAAGVFESGHAPSAENLETIGINQLRREMRANRVTFPAQVPVFVKHDRPDLQRKVVQLYFLLGWSTYRIAARYDMASQRVHQVINTWKQRAVQMGYIQEIPRALARVRPAEASPIQVFLTQVIDGQSARPPQDPLVPKVMESAAEKDNGGLDVRHGENGAARSAHDDHPLTFAGDGDEVTLLRNENRLLKKLLLGLMADRDARPPGTLVEDTRQLAEA